jgi:hypothetical protein
VVELKYYIYRAGRVLMRPIAFLSLCYNDEKVVLHASLKKQFRERRERINK